MTFLRRPIFFTVLVVIPVLATTLVPTAPSLDEAFACIFCGERAMADGLLNLILFVPLGIGLRSAVGTPARSVLAGTLISCLIEVTQFLIPGRDPSLGDVLANGVGTGIGVLFAAFGPRFVRLSDRSSAQLSLTAAFGAITVFTLTGYLLSPSFSSSTYSAQWTPNLGNSTWYRGRILEATLGTLALRPGRIDASDSVRASLLSGAPIVIVAITGPAVPRLSPLLRLHDHTGREIVQVGVHEGDVVFRYRTVGARLRLDQPDARFPEVMNAVSAGDTLRIRVFRDGAALCLAVNGDAHCNVGFTIGSGWGVLLYLESLPKWAKTVLDGTWVAILMLPFGLVVRRQAASMTAGVITIAGLAAVPSLVGLRPTSWADWLGAGLGVGIGAVAGWLIQTRRLPGGR